MHESHAYALPPPERHPARMRTVIVDDEPLARRAIRLRLLDEPDIEIVGEASDGVEAVAVIKSLRPDLVFLDVRMPHKNGFEVLADVTPACMPIVVFVTAYDRYALKAFETHALDYLLKPFTTERFQAALARVRSTFASRHPAGDRREYLRRFTVKHNRRMKLLRVEEVDWIEAGGNYAHFHVGDACYLVRMTLQELEARLDPAEFVRIHRSTIVRVDRVQDLVPVSHGDFDLTLKNGAVLRVSRHYRSRLQW
jgi:two-component system LytT family response regulator